MGYDSGVGSNEFHPLGSSQLSRNRLHHVSKVTASYRLPVALVRKVRMQAAREGLQPHAIAERWLSVGSKSNPELSDLVANSDSEPEPEPVLN